MSESSEVASHEFEQLRAVTSKYWIQLTANANSKNDLLAYLSSEKLLPATDEVLPSQYEVIARLRLTDPIILEKQS